ncbi:SLATT domain-containing protein [Streptomyces sp. NPDC059740]|uniref:SLATT domain-containing protein n=1 Tax=Streptomyces sp. NPDC059740 TaxID=3346926 RepID=UPI003660E81C
MSQPEMQPEGLPRGEGRARRREDGRPRDLAGRTFPLGDWGEPAERLDELYHWVETGALRVADWYLKDRVAKRRAARVLRVGTATGAAAAALLPLLDLTGAVDAAAPWGYAGLLTAVVCACSDRFFGLTAGWMRDVATAQAVQRRLEALQFDWATESVREVLGPTEGTAGEAAERCLGVLRRFTEDIAELVRAETADWMGEFHRGASALPAHAFLPWTPRAEGAPPVPRFPLPPGSRPNMPRQRPPER